MAKTDSRPRSSASNCLYVRRARHVVDRLATVVVSPQAGMLHMDARAGAYPREAAYNDLRPLRFLTARIRAVFQPVMGAPVGPRSIKSMSVK